MTKILSHCFCFYAPAAFAAESIGFADRDNTIVVSVQGAPLITIFKLKYNYTMGYLFMVPYFLSFADAGLLSVYISRRRSS